MLKNFVYLKPVMLQGKTDLTSSSATETMINVLNFEHFSFSVLK